MKEKNDKKGGTQKKKRLYEGTIVTTRTLTASRKIVDEKSEHERIRVKTFVTEPARVSVRLGFVQGLPNYSSKRIEFEVSMPCYREEINEVADAVAEFIKEKISEEIEGPDLNLLD